MRKLSIPLFALFLTIFSGCIKDLGLTDWQSEQDNAIAQNLFDDVYKQVDINAQGEDSLRSPCPAVTFTFAPNIFPGTMVVDFGAQCLGNDGRIRSGRILVNFTGPWRDAGTVVTITLENYVVNGYAVEGTQVMTNMGTNGQGHITYNVVITGGHVTAPNNGGSWSQESNRTYEWVGGENTTYLTDGLNGILDDVYLITGTANGTNRNGRTYTASTPTPLRYQANCRWITAGVLEVVPDGLVARRIDFGNSNDCDPDAVASLGNLNFNIVLP